MKGNELKRWEILPNNANRRYKAKHQMVTLKGSESRVEGSEIVEKVDKQEKKDLEQLAENIKKENMENRKLSINLDGTFYSFLTIINKKNIDRKYCF